LRRPEVVVGWIRRPAYPYHLTAWVSLWVSVAVVAVLFGWGAWQRRWIADDGLIVLRTVRNMLAGNGPVFNAGERVEANTSTAWTFLLYLGGVVGGPLRLEYVALAMALTLSVLGIVLMMLGAGRLYAPSLVSRRAVMLPAGALVYIAVPPARDFATSGLENGLVLAYLGLLWWMMVRWSQLPQAGPERRAFTGALAFVAGCSVLVRPELALIGGLALVLMLVAAHGWRRRVLIVVAGGLLPVAYQIFRMGYYGLLVPGTALAKDAAGDKWSQGLIYLGNFDRPYALWLPAMLVPVLAAVLSISVGGRTRVRRAAPSRPGPPARALPNPARPGPRARAVQNPSTVVVFIAISGLLQALYWIRQGGDFMHGRVLLVPLFCLLAPVAVIPVVFPEGKRFSKETRYLLAGAVSVLWLVLVGWSLWAANSPGMGDDATRVTYSGIVDERRFYAQATGAAHPLTAADYLDYPRMRAALVAINNTPAGAPPPGAAPAKGAHTVFFTNLGMLGMNVGLDVRVIDQIGLANPLAAHTARLQHSRIGHDKNLFPDWAIAEGPYLDVPPYLDRTWMLQARAALKCPATQAVISSVQAPMGPRRFLSNLVHAVQFTRYRVDRVPRYELIRCGMEVPEFGPPPYNGLPATGP
jgi:arabinofuranosyltransferase